jgi:hypothetical protein
MTHRANHENFSTPASMVGEESSWQEPPPTALYQPKRSPKIFSFLGDLLLPTSWREPLGAKTE